LGILLFGILLESLDDAEQDFVKDIYMEYGKTIYKIAYDIVGNKDDAGDALSQVMVKIIKNLKNFTGKSNKEIRSLIVIYCRRTAIDIYRQNKRQTGKEEEPDITDYDIDIGVLICHCVNFTAKEVDSVNLFLLGENPNQCLSQLFSGFIIFQRCHINSLLGYF
jgi:RNA polymerase sigma factor (sigma-70 family)